MPKSSPDADGDEFDPQTTSKYIHTLDAALIMASDTTKVAMAFAANRLLEGESLIATRSFRTLARKAKGPVPRHGSAVHGAGADPSAAQAGHRLVFLRDWTARPHERTVTGSLTTGKGVGGRKSPQMLSPQSGRSKAMYDQRALQSVEVVNAVGEWFVFICEGKGEPVIQPFEIESSARAYAEGQRLRLGLDRFTAV